jgi:hypothetical protein
MKEFEEKQINKSLMICGVSALTLLCLIILMLVFGVAYVFHPWVSPGQTIRVDDQEFGGYQAQVWLRKNSTFVEPFSTGLFLRKKNGKWYGIQIGFDDYYRPKVHLKMEGGRILVSNNGADVGFIDEDLSALKRTDGAVFQLVALGEAPPDNWSIRQP